MKHLKVVVYAISKNEAKFAERWAKSMMEADEVIVLDTGSTDNTVEILRNNNVIVYQSIISPWRFDVARNESLAKVPLDTDICVCTDLDEVFEIGWREKLENYWQKDTTRAKYNYNWKLDEDNNPKVSFWIDKIHSRDNYSWQHPVHEVLTSQKEEKYIEVPITLNHYPDNSKSRSSYLPLLELSVKENPDDDRNLHYLGREYMFYQQWDKSIQTLHQHLKCPKATWKDERSASMRFIARAYFMKDYYEESEFWLKKAIEEAPYLREGYIELANLYNNQERFEESYQLLKKALEIKEKSKSYINEEFAWNETIYDLLSIACFYTKRYQEAVFYCKEAIIINNTNPRYQTNLELMLPYSISI